MLNLVYMIFPITKLLLSQISLLQYNYNAINLSPSNRGHKFLSCHVLHLLQFLLIVTDLQKPIESVSTKYQPKYINDTNAAWHAFVSQIMATTEMVAQTYLKIGSRGCSPVLQCSKIIGPSCLLFFVIPTCSKDELK